ncbi:pre-mRNA-splicing factor CWC25 homolog isoform X2 [Harmonia axyridis]|uniref:pre-mRNA-splicing factor CWC25 homolog isoform X1 n=1 Tax=Harmonia axyridis TaxID=115357 RepID=UPI001E278894|nr:pre-mRNA-splicing factor CWC25 homolog isoform X1 [Harmonia axyridis]XP_045480131.1 pre-mRNA-splicing factor CWC25 homolog isoform X2 [Harmonia axyridis]
MFSNNEEKKLDWMYKGPTALVDREAYLLGRTVDETLELINREEAAKKVDKYMAPPKNHVEHECLPPSIREYNKIVKSEQVDLQAKLQEDPLVLIKRREEETRRQFLQNPVQLKKLQEAMEAQLQMKKMLHSKKNKTGKKLRKKLKLLNQQLGKKHGYKELELSSDMKDDEAILDTILMHKFNQLKNELSEDDLKIILLGNSSVPL